LIVHDLSFEKKIYGIGNLKNKDAADRSSTPAHRKNPADRFLFFLCMCIVFHVETICCATLVFCACRSLGFLIAKRWTSLIETIVARVRAKTIKGLSLKKSAIQRLKNNLNALAS